VSQTREPCHGHTDRPAIREIDGQGLIIGQDALRNRTFDFRGIPFPPRLHSNDTGLSQNLASHDFEGLGFCFAAGHAAWKGGMAS
jgi:hypothetical protein